MPNITLKNMMLDPTRTAIETVGLYFEGTELTADGYSRAVVEPGDFEVVDGVMSNTAVVQWPEESGEPWQWDEVRAHYAGGGYWTMEVAQTIPTGEVLGIDVGDLKFLFGDWSGDGYYVDGEAAPVPDGYWQNDENTGEPTIRYGWSEDLAEIPEWEWSTLSGITEAQAEAIFEIEDGILTYDTDRAIAAGAGSSFTVVALFGPPILFPADYMARVERNRALSGDLMGLGIQYQDPAGSAIDPPGGSGNIVSHTYRDSDAVFRLFFGSDTSSNHASDFLVVSSHIPNQPSDRVIGMNRVRTADENWDFSESEDRAISDPRSWGNDIPETAIGRLRLVILAGRTVGAIHQLDVSWPNPEHL